MKLIRKILCAIAVPAWLAQGTAAADMVDTVARIKPAIVVVGTWRKTDSPQFVLRGTGFVVANGKLVATNAHVLPEEIGGDAPEIVVETRRGEGDSEIRRARIAAKDPDHDLALLSIEGTALPALTLRDSDSVREGQSIGFTGFPIGGALGFSRVTHRGMIASITPIALPGGNSRQLNEKLVRQLKNGSFRIFQLDATAYPGNSGSPVFDADSGEVIGVLNMAFVKGSKEAALTAPSGISFAIPAKHLAALIAQIESSEGAVSR